MESDSENQSNDSNEENMENACQKRKLPRKMTYIRALIDPFNDNNYYIFGSLCNNQCWYFNDQTQTHTQICDIPTKHSVFNHNCAIFKTQNKNKYVLIYDGGSANAICNIYNLKTKKWIENPPPA